MQGAAKVGVFVVAFIALLFGAYAVLGRSLGRKPTTTLIAEFSDAGGTTPGTAVQMAGIAIGTVERVELASGAEGPIGRVVMAIDEGITIPPGSVAQVQQSLIGFGSSPVQIVPPAKLASGSGGLADGSTIPGVNASPLDNVLPGVKPTLETLNETLVATKNLISDQGLRERLDKLLASVTATSTKFGALADRFDSTVAQNQPSIKEAVDNVALSMENIRKTTEKVNELVASGKLEGQATALLEQLNKAAVRGEQLMVSLDSFVNDPELRNNLHVTTGNIAKISDSGTRIAQDAEVMSKNGITITERVAELTNKASILMDDVQGMVQKVDRFLSRGTGGSSGIGPITSEFTLSRETDPNRLRTDVNLSTRIGKDNYYFGVFDAFESNRITLQQGRPLGDRGEFRYGMYASKPGIGVDYSLARPLQLRADVFGLNKTRFDLSARYHFGNGVFGWAGVQKILDRNAPAFGIGIRR